MTIEPWVWAITIAGIVGLLAFDYVAHVRVAHTPTLRESAVWSAIYIGAALLFGVAVWVAAGGELGMEYFAGYLTEKALSVDNLFVFLIIMSSFRVPRADQQKVLLFGIVFSLVARTGFIFVGVALIQAFSWVFYLFGLILLLTAGHLLKGHDDQADAQASDNLVVRLAKRVIPTSDHFDGDRLTTTVDGRRAMTPMLLVMVAIGGTDILFALDSIPAIFGLTQSAYIVFTATAFSLMGLRQLFFLIDGLLDRLVYLSYGLAAILGFIGAKLVLHALHENTLPFINGGRHVEVIEVDTGLSLAIILGTLAVTVLASLLSPRGRALATIHNLRRHATEYLDISYETDPVLREAGYRRLLDEEDALGALDTRFRPMVHDARGLLELLARAHATHDDFVLANPAAYPDGNPHAGRPRPYHNAGPGSHHE